MFLGFSWALGCLFGWQGLAACRAGVLRQQSITAVRSLKRPVFIRGRIDCGDKPLRQRKTNFNCHQTNLKKTSKLPKILQNYLKLFLKIPKKTSKLQMKNLQLKSQFKTTKNSKILLKIQPYFLQRARRNFYYLTINF